MKMTAKLKLFAKDLRKKLALKMILISANHAPGVTSLEVEISQETRCLCSGFLLVNGDPIRQSVIWP